MKVPYTKQIQSFADQIKLLKQRGLKIGNQTEAEAWLRQVSYYRMSGYWYPLLADRDNHIFKAGATFENAVRIYEFDSHLRRLVMAYVEQIEIAVRTQVAYIMSMASDGFWFEDATLFSNSVLHAKTLQSINDEYNRSDEQFVKAFKSKYIDPFPPSWMTLEITSFGTMSILFQQLKPGRPKRDVASAFGVSDIVFASWLHTLVYVRNICAHHARLWNRSFGIRPLMPRHPRHQFIALPASGTQRVYFALSIIRYLLNIISPQNDMTNKLKTLLTAFPEIDTAAMGFPNGWDNEPVWC
ncbi:MAG: Abi family protein [Bacteroidales bacterium]|nr:Abi family protein [Bacteroidales bacterium]